jgi:hypothetical protein
MYISFDNGKHWQKFQLNLPTVPVTDLLIKDGSLIAATQGRSIWMVDDLSPLHQLTPDLVQQQTYLFKPSRAYRMEGGSVKGSKTAGENRPNGVFVYFYLKNKPTEKDTISLVFMSQSGDTIKTYSTISKDYKLDVKEGCNLFVWNLRYPDAKKFDGMVLWSYDLTGPRAKPGQYRVKLISGKQVQESTFEIVPDKRSTATPADFDRQFDFVQTVGKKLTDMHTAITGIRDLRQQMKALAEKLPAVTGKPETDRYKPLRTQIAHIDSTITGVEEALYQTKNRSSQDPLNFPVRLNDKLANLMGLNAGDDFPPTDQSLEVRNVLFEQADAQLAKWKTVLNTDLPALNRLVHSLEIDAVRIKTQ